jgi:hypothetical protein
MHISAFPIEILSEFLRCIYSTNVKTLVFLYEAMFWSTPIMRTKLHSAMDCVEIDADKIFNIEDLDVKCILENICAYIAKVSYNCYDKCIHAKKNVDPFLALASKFTKLKYLDFDYIGTRDWVLPELVFNFKNLSTLKSWTTVDVRNLLQLPNLKVLYCEQIKSETYTEQFGIEDLVLCPKLFESQCRGWDLPYAQMFPELRSLELFSADPSVCNFDITDLQFLIWLRIGSYKDCNITLGNLPSLEVIRIDEFIGISFYPESNFASLRKIGSRVKMSEIGFENLTANENLAVVFDFAHHGLDKITLCEIESKYKLTVCLWGFAPTLPVVRINKLTNKMFKNYKRVSGLTYAMAKEFAGFNVEIFRNVRVLCIRLNKNDVGWPELLMSAISLEKLSVKKKCVTLDQMRTFVTIPELKMSDADHAMVNLFIASHRELVTLNPKKICTHISIGIASPELATYAKQAGIRYTRI